MRHIQFFILGSALASTLLGARWVQASENTTELFSSHDCEPIRQLMSPRRVPYLRMHHLGVTSYCQPTNFKLDPYLEKLTPTDWSYLLIIRTGRSRETNPFGRSDSSNRIRASRAWSNDMMASLLKANQKNYFGINYFLSNSNYNEDTRSSFWAHSFETPFAFQVGKREHMILKPLLNYVVRSDRAYRLASGIALQGAYYGDQFKQSAEGSFFWDKYYPGNLAAQDGTHIRFDYFWSYFPGHLYLRLNPYVEHLQASRDRDLDSDSLTMVPYSNNQLGFDAFAEYDTGPILLSLNPTVNFRVDVEDTNYFRKDKVYVQKAREDDTVTIYGSAALRLADRLRLVVYYQWDRTYSNMDLIDYQDRNIQNQTFGIALRTYLTNYR